MRVVSGQNLVFRVGRRPWAVYFPSKILEAVVSEEQKQIVCTTE